MNNARLNRIANQRRRRHKHHVPLSVAYGSRLKYLWWVLS